MRKVAGEFARAYNKRKARINSFWGDNFHATLVDTGEYLWRCLRYIEMNMVRCKPKSSNILPIYGASRKPRFLTAKNRRPKRAVTQIISSRFFPID